MCICIAEAVEKSSTDGGETETSVKTSPGDGCESGEIVPGKSVVFASLEVCLCALVRHLPALNPSLPPASVLASSARQTAFTDTTYQLLSTTLLTVAELPSLCSPAGLSPFLCIFMPVHARLAGKGIGLSDHHSACLFIRPFVCLLTNLWTQYFEN